ncbi:HNH/ENDO VII family nuclease [Pseudoalteromonas piscicida]|nr:GH-E family nuclease [Pseudoalteromonas piscicida]MCG9771357.1 HNH/ENDO VII family nuclease [Pseudoalteromonas piscicida]
MGKVILKNTGGSLSAALAVLRLFTQRKVDKGDPVKYLRDINWQDLGKQSATEVKNIVKGLRDSLDDMSTSWHYDLLLPDAAIEGMQATVKRLDEVTPKIDQHMQQAAQEIGQRVNKALDEYQGQSPIRGVTDKPTKAKADELEPPKGNELPGAKNNSSNNTKTKKARKISNRLKYLGKTPSKTSRTGKEVIARMRKEGKIRDKFGKTQFKDSKGNWHPLSQADMAHDPTDAVRWWNTKGRQYGAKSKEVRKWMLDPNNYTLDHYSLNRSAGAKLKETYLSPINKLKK